MKKIFRDSMITVAGTFILAIGVSFFILPFNILSGGTAGIAIALKPLLQIPETIIINILVYSLFITGWIFLGRSFAAKTALSSLLYPIMINILSQIDYSLKISDTLASLYGGLICGLGIGIVMRVGASTGGMDIPSLIFHELTGIKTSILILITDVLCILLGLYTYGLEAVLVGLIAAISSSWMIDKTLNLTANNTITVCIISDQWKRMNQSITADLKKETVLIDTQGGYTMDSKKIILVVIDKKQYPKLLKLVELIDKYALMMMAETQNIL